MSILINILRSSQDFVSLRFVLRLNITTIVIIYCLITVFNIMSPATHNFSIFITQEKIATFNGAGIAILDTFPANYFFFDPFFFR